MSIFVHSSAKLTKSSRKVHKKGAEKYTKMGTVNDPTIVYYFAFLGTFMLFKCTIGTGHLDA
jgi:hypothetical protein